MTESVASEKSVWSRRLQRHWGWITVFVVLALAATVRIRLLDLPLERDEGEYAYAGQLILEGIPPYQLAYNMKFPGTYAAYALIMAGFGQTPAGIHFGVMCVTTLTSLLLYWFGRKLLDEVTGVVAATAHAVLAASPALLGLAGHATHFATLFATASLGLLWPLRQEARWPRAAAGGLMLGLALLMKQHAAVLGVWGLAFVIAASRRQPQLSWKKKGWVIAGYSLGVVLPFGLTCGILWRAGVFERFWFWTIGYAREYVSQTPLADAPLSFWRGLSEVTEHSAWLWVTAAIGVGMIWFDVRMRAARLALLGFGGAAFLTTCPGFFFREHYFLLVLPAITLLAGSAVSAAYQLWGKVRPGVLAGGPLGVYLLLLAWTVFANREIWFQATPAQAARAIYPGNPLVESEAIAGFIRTNSTPDTQVAVLGSEPQIYFLARRHSATGYLYTYALMEAQPFARAMQVEMIREIELAKPGYIVLVTVRGSWGAGDGANASLLNDWGLAYLANYTLVGVADMHGTNATRYVWGPAAANGTHGGIMVLQRRPFPGDKRHPPGGGANQ